MPTYLWLIACVKKANDWEVKAELDRRRKTNPSFDAWCSRDDVLFDLAPALIDFATSVAAPSIDWEDKDPSQAVSRCCAGGVTSCSS